MMFVNGLPPVSEHARWFSVKFGDWMGYHACNFIAKGQIGFEGDLFTLRGSRHWVTWQRALMFVGIMFAPLVVGMLIGPIPAYIISHYVCVSKATESFHLGRVQGVKRQKRKVIVKIAKENGKTQQAVIYGLNEEDARSIAELFETRGHPITAQR